MSGILEHGFCKTQLDAVTKKDHMVLGHGFHFVPDAKVADFVQGAGAKVEKSMLFARVTCGGELSGFLFPQESYCLILNVNGNVSHVRK